MMARQHEDEKIALIVGGVTVGLLTLHFLYRRLKSPLGIKGMRQSVVVTNNPSTIDQN